jgi:serine/threonine-protein kinase
VIGTRVGPYEVVAKLGEGGMGEVYRARDHKLGRDVALKVISGLPASDPERLARFRREAQVLAALNHPNIAQIYGVEDAAGDAGPALVLELVDGPTLADRMAAGPIPLDEVLTIARQIADALFAAHEGGIVHRDLKPANIKLRTGTPGSASVRGTTLESGGGTVKILDFGLAKALTSDTGAGASPMSSPTITAHGTQFGVILGTAAYMAPEQARGKPVDRRADVWAFGVVLYEMLTGRRAFEGTEVSDVLASVLKDTPALEALPADTPPSIRRLLRRALEKDPARRLDSMAAARLELDDVHVGDGAAGAGGEAAGRRSVLVPAAVAAILSGAAVGGAMWALRDAPSPPAVVRLSMTPPLDQPIGIETNHADVAITPDGRRVVYLAENAQSRWFVVRPLDQAEGVALNKLGERPRGPFISPEGGWIAYQSGRPVGRGNELRKVPIDGGPPVTICGIEHNMRGGSWAPDGTIVFATVDVGAGLMRVAAAGGTPEVITTPDADAGELDHLWPQHLPGGRHVLFAIVRTDGTWDAALLSLDTRTWRVLIKDAFAPQYVSTGHLLYATAGGVRAVPFDLDALEIRGDPIEVQPGVLTKESGAADFAVSANGTFVYLPGGMTENVYRLAWMEPDGRETPVAVPAQNYRVLRVSPEGRRAIALVSARQGMPGTVWLIDLERETAIRLTPADLPVNVAIWHPDGRQIVFGISGQTLPADVRGLYRIGVSGTGVPERWLPLTNRVLVPAAWTPDGRQLIVVDRPGMNPDIGQLPFAAAAEVTALIAGSAPETAPALSPDGRWLAYVLNEDGPQVFVRPYPDVDMARVPVSNGPGTAPAWSRDGRQLYFVTPGGQELMVVDVEGPIDPASASIAFSRPRPVMPLRDELNEAFPIATPPVNGRFLRAVRVAPTGERPTEYQLVLNWTEELQLRLPPR